jgi:FtsP/CotA-like multicopper oxidase with cupredoxin domain
MQGHDHGAPGAPAPDGSPTAAGSDGHAAMGHGGDDRTRAGDRTGHAAMGHAGGEMAGSSMAARVTFAQQAAVTLITLLAFIAGILFSMSYANLTLSARDVGGAVMPPGMIQTRDTPAEAMRDMAAVDLRHVAYTAPADARGDQLLQPRLENGVKVFDLDVSVIRWNILPSDRVAAYAFNGQVPGPRIRVSEGDRVRLNVTNSLPEPTSVHWHGLILPNVMDGPAEITQEPIEPGGSYTYEFTAQQRGTFFYHSHAAPDRQQALGMYGALIIDPRDPTGAPAYDRELVVQLQEWTFKDGYTFPAMPMEGALPNFFTINGKAYPATETVDLRVGERLLVRFIGSSSAFIHPMHIHGGPFRIVETDGYPVPEAAQVLKDTVNVGPGERYDVIWEAREPGKWLLHCHINHHTTNNNREEQGAGGLTMVINVT